MSAGRNNSYTLENNCHSLHFSFWINMAASVPGVCRPQGLLWGRVWTQLDCCARLKTYGRFLAAIQERVFFLGKSCTFFSYMFCGFLWKALFWKIGFFTLKTQVPNRIVLDRDGLAKTQLDKYKSKRKMFHIHRAAARIWARGVPWSDSLKMVTEAFDATTFEVS